MSDEGFASPSSNKKNNNNNNNKKFSLLNPLLKPKPKPKPTRRHSTMVHPNNALSVGASQMLRRSMRAKKPIDRYGRFVPFVGARRKGGKIAKAANEAATEAVEPETTEPETTEPETTEPEREMTEQEIAELIGASPVVPQVQASAASKRSKASKASKASHASDASQPSDASDASDASHAAQVLCRAVAQAVVRRSLRAKKPVDRYAQIVMHDDASVLPDGSLAGERAQRLRDARDRRQQYVQDRLRRRAARASAQH